MPRIAVITPYFKEPLEILRQCHDSVRAQGLQADHIMVADGFPREELAGWDVRHVVLPSAHDDGGATPRGIASMMADAEGYDFIAYLDADNWYEAGHLASLLELHRSTGAPVCSSFRNFRTPEGAPLDISEREEDLAQHVDTSCFLLHRPAFGVLSVWTRMPHVLATLCDRVFLAGIRKERFAIASTRQRTVAYRTLHELHYTQAGLQPPAGFKSRDMMKAGMDWLRTKEGVDESLRRLGFWPLTFI
jgi:glycosyltransferase involved in cell wall biosynthesis